MPSSRRGLVVGLLMLVTAIAFEAQAVGNKDQDPEFRSFVDTGRSKLEAIDDLLKQEGTNR